MNAKLTQNELQAIKERAEKATLGPWKADKCGGGVKTEHPEAQEVSGYWGGSHNGVCNLNDGEYIENSNDKHDAEFIANARQDIPNLLAEVERLNAIIADLELDAKCNEDATEIVFSVLSEENERLRKAIDSAISLLPDGENRLANRHLCEAIEVDEDYYGFFSGGDND